MSTSALGLSVPDPREQLEPLTWLEIFFLPLLLLLAIDASKRRYLERRALRTSELQERSRARKMVKKALDHEANEFWQIIQDCYARLGHAYVPNKDYQNASGSRKGKVQKVRVERVLASLDAPEIIYYKLSTQRKTYFGAKNALPYKTFVGDLISEDRLQELSWACQRVVTACYEDPRYGVWLRVHRLEGVGGLPTRVLFKDMLEHYPDDMSAGTLILGVGAHRNIHTADLAKHPHILIAGSTGSGKSNMVNHLIASLMTFTDPKDLQFILIDLKRMEFKLFRKSGHLHRPVITEAQEAIEALNGLVEEIERRARLMEDTDVKEVGEWNERFPDQAQPRLICIIDEFAELRLASDKKISEEAARLVNRICNLGRAVGIHLIICTQRPARAVLGNEVKINMPLIIAGRTQSTAQSAVILDNGHAAGLPLVPGRMLYQSGSSEWEIQTPYIDQEDIKRAVRVSRAKAEPVHKAERARLSQTEVDATVTEQAEPEPIEFTFDIPLRGLQKAKPISEKEVEAAEDRLEASERIVEPVQQSEPAKVQAVIQDKTADELIDGFILARCSVGKTVRSWTKDLYEALQDYCKDQEAVPPAKKQFGLALKARGFKSIRGTGGIAGWEGLTLKAHELSEVSELSEDEEPELAAIAA